MMVAIAFAKAFVGPPILLFLLAIFIDEDFQIINITGFNNNNINISNHKIMFSGFLPTMIFTIVFAYAFGPSILVFLGAISRLALSYVDFTTPYLIVSMAIIFASMILIEVLEGSSYDKLLERICRFWMFLSWMNIIRLLVEIFDAL